MVDVNDILRRAKEQVDQLVAEKRLAEAQKRDDDELARLETILGTNEAVVEAIKDSKLSIDEISSAFAEAVSKVKVASPVIPKFPEIKIPKAEVKVTIPEIKAPEVKIPQIKVPQPKVTVNIPPVKAPIVNIPKTIFPDSMDVGLSDFTSKNPMPVMSVDPKGRFVSPSVGAAGGRSLQRKERVSAPKTDSFVAIGVSSTKLLDANEERHTFTIVNDGPEIVYISHSTKATVNSGIRLNGNGGTYSNDIYIGPLAGCTGTVSNPVTILEL